MGGRWGRLPENTLKCGCLVGKGFGFLLPSHSLPVDYPPFRSFTVATRIFGTFLAPVEATCSQRLLLGLRYLNSVSGPAREAWFA